MSNGVEVLVKDKSADSKQEQVILDLLIQIFIFSTMSIIISTSSLENTSILLYS